MPLEFFHYNLRLPLLWSSYSYEKARNSQTREQIGILSAMATQWIPQQVLNHYKVVFYVSWDISYFLTVIFWRNLPPKLKY